jgi:hypothetical protein
MRTEELIDLLAREAVPVRRSPPPALLAALLVAFALAASMAGAWLMGTRPDLSGALANPSFLLANAVLFGLLALAAAGSGALAVPGRVRRLRPRAVLGALLLAAAILVFLLRWPWLYGVSWGLWLSWGANCTLRTLVLGGPATAVGIWLHRRGASTQPALSGGLIGGAAGSQGANAMGWACGIDEPLHVLLWHFVIPTVLLAALGAWAGRRWLRW